MSITIYADVILPHSVVAAGLRGRQIRKNTRTRGQNGQLNVNVDWARTQREFELGVVPMLPAAWAALEGLFEVTEGGAFGFLMKDPKDESATHTSGVCTLITGTTYQLWKRYTSIGSTRTKDRKITRPIASGFELKASGATVPGANYTLNSVTGVLTIPSAPAAATLTWAAQFYVPVHFANDQVDWTLLRSGPADTRLLAGPSVLLAEVPE